MRKLFQFSWDMGYGCVEGLFVAEQEEVDAVIGKEVYFGAVLGRYSDVSGPVLEEEIKVVTEDQDFIEMLLSIFSSSRISGYNPLDYVLGE
jgi:hypothetical protein